MEAEPVAVLGDGALKLGKKRRKASAEGGEGAQPRKAPAKASKKPGKTKVGKKTAKRAGDDDIEAVEGAGDSDDGREEENPGMLLTDLVQRPDSTAASSLLSKAKPKTRGSKTKVSAKRPVDDGDDGLLAEMLGGLGDDEGGFAGNSSDEEGGRALQPQISLVGAGAFEDGTDAAAPMVPPESEFHAGSAEETITMDDLLEPLTGTTGLGEVRRQLQGLASTEPMPEPMSEAKKGREERAVQYQSSSKDAGKWIPQVQRMRRADQVDLITQEEENAGLAKSTQGIIGSFRETDDFEKELRQIIDAAGTTEEAMKDAKVLPMNTAIRDEKQTRQVAKLKALMLREQATSKRVKKIKSKAYRRIHRKAETRDREALLERLEIENPELAKALKQEYEKKHAERRMLRQRNARRKWATTMRRFAKNDQNAQQEVTKQAQIAHDEDQALKRAVRGKDPDQSDESDAVDLSGSESGDENVSTRKQTLNKAKKLTMDEIKYLEQEGELPTTGILGMNFMRDAIKRKREEAKEEAKSVLKELERVDERLDDAAEADSDEEARRQQELQKSEQEAKKRGVKTFTEEELAQARKEVDAILEKDDAATECTVSGPLTVHGVAADQVTKPAPNFRVASERTAVTNANAAEASSPSKLSGDSKTQESAEAAAAAAANPWLQEAAESDGLEAASAVVDAAAGKGKKTKAKAKVGTKKSAKKNAKPAGEEAASGDDSDGDDVAEDVRNAASANPWLREATDTGGVEVDAEEGASAGTKTSKSKSKSGKKKNKKKSARHDGEAGGSGNDSDGEDDAAAANAEDVLSALNADSETMREQRELVRTAFVSGTQEDDFEAEVEEAERETEEAKKKPELIGWGSWTGPGITERKPKGKGKGEDKGRKADEAEKKKIQRVQFLDGNKAVDGKYFVDKVPFPFQNPDQYNKELRMPSGPEWNTLETFKQKVKPKVHLKAGAIVPPLQYVKHLPPEKRDGAIEAWGSAKAPKRLKARF